MDEFTRKMISQSLANRILALNDADCRNEAREVIDELYLALYGCKPNKVINEDPKR